MAITVDWGQRIINVPKSDTQLVQSSPTEIRQLDIDTFRLALNSLQDDEQGITYSTTHNHVAPITVGGVTLARVIEITNGYTVTFEDGNYAVNLVGANSNIADVTNLNQVSIRSSNSAGLTFSDQINDQSYLGGAVWIDTVSGSLGTQFPRGTPTSPSLTFADAKVIAQTKNFNNFTLSGFLSLLGSDNLSSTNWGGKSVNQSGLTFNGNDADGAVFENMDLSGSFGGTGVVSSKNCRLTNLSGFKGHAKECTIFGTLQVDSNFSGEVVLIDCDSGVPGPTPAIIDLNFSTASLQVRGWHGGLTLLNAVNGQNISIDADSCSLTIDSSCTSANIVVRGSGTYTNNSLLTITKDGWLDPSNLITSQPVKRPGFRL